MNLDFSTKKVIMIIREEVLDVNKFLQIKSENKKPTRH